MQPEQQTIETRRARADEDVTASGSARAKAIASARNQRAPRALLGARALVQRLTALTALAVCACSDAPDARLGPLDPESLRERERLEAILGGAAGSSVQPAPPPARSDAPVADCTSVEAALDVASAATYAVVARLIEPATGDVVPQFFATAFAIDEHVLVTNGHVVEELGDIITRFEYLDIVGVQSGTGRVIRLDRALSHPGFNGDTLSPDVGLLGTDERLDELLELEPADGQTRVVPGDEIFVVGFPGDVAAVIDIVPERTVPQATTLSGSVSALRNFDSAVIVAPDNVDVIQHTAPTSGGTSGSALLRCGRVAGVNNAGTMTPVINIGPNGEPVRVLVPSASNNFAIDRRHVHDLLARVSRGERLDDLDLNAHPPVSSPAPAPPPPDAPPPPSGVEEGTSWIAYSLEGDASVDCDLVNGADFEAVVELPGRNLLSVTDADRRFSEVTVNTRNEIIQAGTRIGDVLYAPTADGTMLLWALALNGTVLALEDSNAGLFPEDFTGGAGFCGACGYVDDPVPGRCP